MFSGRVEEPMPQLFGVDLTSGCTPRSLSQHSRSGSKDDSSIKEKFAEEFSGHGVFHTYPHSNALPAIVLQPQCRHVFPTRGDMRGEHPGCRRGPHSTFC